MKNSALVFLLMIVFIPFKGIAQDKSEEQIYKTAKKLFDDSQYIQALPLFVQLNALDPDNISYYYRLGACLVMTEKDIPEGIKHLNRTYEARPDFVFANLFLVKAYTLNEEFDKGNFHYHKYLEAETEEIHETVLLANEILNELHMAMDGLVEDEKEVLLTENRLLEQEDVTEGSQIVNIENAENVLGNIPVAVTIKKIFFDFDNSTLNSNYLKYIDDVYLLLKENKETRVEITGHTDSKGPDAYNLRLGERRAKAVCNELIKRGIETSRIIVITKGESTPYVNNENSDGSDDFNGRAANRRIEFKLLNLDKKVKIKYEENLPLNALLM
ncbi:MAG: OmpA family protein [Bacteroidota bacterium]|nr:OmpA family protein [Bacteroidota bacterium]